VHRSLLVMWPLQQLLSDKRQNSDSFCLVKQNRRYQLYWLMCNWLSSFGFGLYIGVDNFIFLDMESIKKFRIGSGLQNFHICTTTGRYTLRNFSWMAEVHGIWNFLLRSCFSWIYSDSAPTPTHFKVLDSDSCSNSKVNYLNFWQCLNDRIRFSH